MGCLYSCILPYSMNFYGGITNTDKFVTNQKLYSMTAVCKANSTYYPNPNPSLSSCIMLCNQYLALCKN